MLTVGLLWHSQSSSNLGVGALTLSQMAIVERAAAKCNENVQFRVFGWSEKSHSASSPNVISHCGIQRNFFIPWKSPFLNQIRECNVVLDIGEGDSFSDIYGLERFAYFSCTKLAVYLSGRPLILSPQTIGPFEQYLTRTAANFTMRKCRKVFARDHLSLEYLRNNNIKNSDEAIDVAFALPYRKMSLHSSEKIRVGINVSGLLYSGGYTRDNQFNLSLDYVALTHEMLDWFSSNSDCEVHLVSHVVPDSMDVENDLLVCQALKKRYPNAHVVDKFSSPIDAKTFISSMDFFVGARMHACIAAFSSGVPVIPLAYSRKFNGLFESLNYSFFGDCKKDSLEKIMNLVKDAFSRRVELKVKVESGNQIAQTRIAKYEDYLVKTFKEINATRINH